MMMNTRKIQLSVHHQIIVFAVIICLPFLCSTLETNTTRLVIKDPETLVSPGNVFQFGFFSPDDTTSNRYLGVFYTVSPETVIWVANRDDPVVDSASRAAVSDDGNLVLLDARNQTIWSTNVTATSTNTTVQILDSGNLVLRNRESGSIIWDSFSHPCDVFVPTMRITRNVNTGTEVKLTAWKSRTDPGIGSYISALEVANIPQVVAWRNGRMHWRSGPWNGLIFIGARDMYSPYLDGFNVVNDAPGSYYFTAPEVRFLTNVRLNSSGSFVQTVWDDQKKRWDTTWFLPQNECDLYGTCGPFSSCNYVDTPICSCLKGFEPSNEEEWKRGNWSGGCRRRKALQCTGDRFFRMGFMKVPDFVEKLSYFVEEGECEGRCLRNCSCIAYAFDAKIGCMFWRDTLIDTQEFTSVGPALYIRLSASELENHKENRRLYIAAFVVVGFVCLSAFIFIALFWKSRNRTKNKKIFEAGRQMSSSHDSAAIVVKDEADNVNIEELPLFTFEMLENATNQFDDNCILGRGGFGPVYKGNLSIGKEIAVKRLSAASRQGVQEFMNEVIVISKLQHRNLVKLLGCCVEKEEKMLVYEYMPNKSLDFCLFDQTHPSENVLDWTKRFSIIEGIGRGLLYLHRDSRLRIIHRDLKPSNVLLDEDWNPKISDFGMARIFGGNQDHGDTARVVGTYGYMAPEYAMEGRFSEKSDVYSFGVVMLEIIKGKKNAHYYDHENSLSLLACAWKLWIEDNSSAFIDESIASSDFQEEIVRCIQIGLLCVQEFPKDRPSIQTVLSMLSREIVDLPPPEQPVVSDNWNGGTTGSTPPVNQVGYSVNELTLTVLDGR